MTSHTASLTESLTEGCPIHPEPYLQKPTVWKSILPVSESIGDQVFYCAGYGGRCSWVLSVKLGIVVPAGLRRVDKWETLQAYQEMVAQHKEKSSDLEDYRRRYGRLPWEVE